MLLTEPYFVDLKKLEGTKILTNVDFDNCKINFTIFFIPNQHLFLSLHTKIRHNTILHKKSDGRGFMFQILNSKFKIQRLFNI